MKSGTTWYWTRQILDFHHTKRGPILDMDFFKHLEVSLVMTIKKDGHEITGNQKVHSSCQKFPSPIRHLWSDCYLLNWEKHLTACLGSSILHLEANIHDCCLSIGKSYDGASFTTCNNCIKQQHQKPINYKLTVDWRKRDHWFCRNIKKPSLEMTLQVSICMQSDWTQDFTKFSLKLLATFKIFLDLTTNVK